MMISYNINILFIASILIPILSVGCADTVYFGTSTRLGVDFSIGTNDAGIGYKSAQIANIPPDKNGDGYSVVGKSDVDLSISNIVVNEEFATGDAADCLGVTEGSEEQASDYSNDNDTPHLTFGSYNAVSIIDINFGGANPFAGAVIGYKRATATIIPVEEDKLRSVYAKTNVSSIGGETQELDNTRTGGIRFIQQFATGKAAKKIASKRGFVAQFDGTKSGSYDLSGYIT